MTWARLVAAVSSEVWHAFGGTAPEAYQRFLVPTIFGPWAEELVTAGSPAPGNRVLDIACGTGSVARLAANRVGTSGKVVGLDLNDGMLSVARSIPASVEWKEGDATRLPFSAGEFEVVFCQQGLQFFPDKLAALGEIRRVLAPNGKVALSVWRPMDRSPGFQAIANALSRQISREAAELAALPFSLSDEKVLEQLVKEAGFRSISIRGVTKPFEFPSVDQFVRQYTSGSLLATVAAKASEEQLHQVVQDVSAQLKTPSGSRGFSSVMESNIVTAHR